MKKFILSIMCIVLVGCSSKFGNYSNASVDISSAMAQDVTEQLNSFYSPATTLFKFKNSIPPSDHFGLMLQDNLRQKGFAIQLKVVNSNTGNNQDIGLSTLPLSYIVDKLDTKSYRVTVYLPEAIFSRAYSIDEGKFQKIGNWVKGN
ncbi:conjugal transfer protein TrbH [Phocoenobacter uteri]|uniref:Conjugal transfer protein TrbH n=1 Tax=Phocoenobacter uteri TaxID=146806 RepID=A0A379DFP1_9PAST|nr:hypothetical protein [Phocoenobacter uteri]MDG6882811.1 hypothetical protein [Phocoenobacter uteri]MDG6882850.1 hypothetical protein [Phocoenobacter uteri]SUB76405.1 conjugal transfer protein TrbH [Phocoenobacter uteri]